MSKVMVSETGVGGVRLTQPHSGGSRYSPSKQKTL